MSRPFVKGEAAEIVIDTANARQQRVGKKLMLQLFDQLGPGRATTVLYVALTEALIGILHIESPMPEVNIEAIHQLLATLSENTANHEDCAIHLSEAMKIQQALDAGDIEAPDELTEVVTVH